ncbi:MAG: DNA-3-methyladenine glycosylase I [Desulfobacteraceae bacterium]|nr:DNA-3-methyladenine glycosylase I [Desulfobacteraceae bacterium]
MDTFNKFDAIVKNVDLNAKNQMFTDEVTSRNNRYANTVLAEKNNLLRVMATLIAFSNNAPSDAVGEIIEGGIFERVFYNFDLDKVASLNPDDIVSREWEHIKSIRFKKKIDAIVRCAKLLKKNGKDKATIESIYKNYNLPKDINNENDILKFWEQFDRIFASFKKSDMPYFKNDTTLLHLLLHLGFPCVKPDLIIMKVAASLGIVKARENHNTYSSEEKKVVVKTIQKYCLLRNIKPAVMDLYILIYGGQKYALRYVTNGYVPISI